MNTPNKLTLFRVTLVPFFLLFLMTGDIPYNFLLAFLIFVLASITDFIDGYLARKNNQITTFGKFLDPLADKILVVSVLICFVELGIAGSISIILIVAREFMVTSIRLVSVSSDGDVIAASNMGKIKTATQMIGIIFILGWLAFLEITKTQVTESFFDISKMIVFIMAIITVISGIEYFLKHKKLINTTK